MNVELPPRSYSLLREGPIGDLEYAQGARLLVSGEVGAVFVRTEVETAVIANAVGQQILGMSAPPQLHRSSVTVIDRDTTHAVEVYVLHEEDYDFQISYDMPSLFSPEDGYDVMEKVATAWEFLGEPPIIPYPQFEMICPNPACQSMNVQYSRVSFGMRDTSPHPYRADVSFKCRICSMFWTFGLVVSKEVYSAAVEIRQVWDWRNMVEHLEAVY